jgi:hypothetical protein
MVPTPAIPATTVENDWGDNYPNQLDEPVARFIAGRLWAARNGRDNPDHGGDQDLPVQRFVNDLSPIEPIRTGGPMLQIAISAG